MNDLYKHINYSAPMDNLISMYIREYDISKANINILYKYGAINRKEYEFYLGLDRMSRQIQIGLLEKSNPRFVEILKNGVIEAKKNLFEANNIESYEVLSIKNDAVFLINRVPTITKFDNIEFVCKNVYTSFYKLSGKEYYYLFDSINQIENIDIKGIDDQKLLLHKEYFLDFLLTVFNSAQTEPIEETIGLLKHFYLSYINRSLDIGYYRRFDGESCFDLEEVSKYSSFKAIELPQSHINSIDISYNLKILTQLIKIYSGIYFQRNRKMT